MVGTGLHRVDERRAGTSAVPGARTTPRAERARVLRPPRAGSTDRASRTGTDTRHRRVLLLPLLVQRPPPPRAARRRRAPIRPARHAVLPLLGERELDADLGRWGQRGAPGAVVRRGRRRAASPSLGGGLRRPAVSPNRRPAGV